VGDDDMGGKIINYKALGKRIQLRRRQLGLSQCEAAEQLNLSTSFYSRLERGERVASMETLIRMANYYELSLDFLFQESLEQDISDTQKAELAQAFTGKSQLQTDQLINWLNVLSDNIDRL